MEKQWWRPIGMLSIPPEEIFWSCSFEDRLKDV